jgi:integrase
VVASGDAAGSATLISNPQAAVAAAPIGSVATVSNGNLPAALPAGVFKIKQVKTKVSERTKKARDGSVSKCWDVQVGSALVRVYFTPSGERELFTVSYWVDGQRKRSVAPTLELAIAAAKAAGGELNKGDLGAAELSAPQRVACARALQILEPTGVPIEVAAGDAAMAYTRLAGKATLATVVDFYLRRHVDQVKPVAEVIEECLKAKREDRLSQRYLKQLDYDFKRFKGRFKNCIGDVLGPDVDAWLRGLGVSSRTRNNMRMSVQTLMRFAKSRRYLPKDHDEMESVPLAKEVDGAIAIFTPAELRELLGQAPESLVPFLVLGAFAGVRHAEIQRLEWQDVQLEHDLIEVRAAKAKTASRRTIPIAANLKGWLKPLRQKAGVVCEFSNIPDRIESLVTRVNHARRAAWAQAHGMSAEALEAAEVRARARRQAERAAGKGRRKRGTVAPSGAETAAEEGWRPFAWKQNALRHSFISYRVAAVQNVAQVALEAGNSPQMIFKHYRELVRPAVAKEWFGIAPESKKQKVESRN